MCNQNHIFKSYYVAFFHCVMYKCQHIILVVFNASRPIMQYWEHSFGWRERQNNWESGGVQQWTVGDCL